MRRNTLLLAIIAVLAALAPATGAQPAAALQHEYEYKLLATNKTSTMQREMNVLSTEGYQFEGVMGGETSFGGSETVVVMGRPRGGTEKGRYAYKLLATNKTSTMQKELQKMGDEGFEYKGQTVFKTGFGGQEVVIILERDTTAKNGRFLYKLLATKKTSTMQKELSEAAVEGFQFVGVTVAETSFGGNEVVSIMRRRLE
ncbi:MAG: hypothetical protein ACRD5F_14860 [Candidatus Acidiferrales bacterium]